MILPAGRSLWIQAILILSSIIAAPLTYETPLFPLSFKAALLVEAVLLGLIVLDGLLLPGKPSYTVTRSFQGRFQENRTVTVELKFEPMDHRAERKLHYIIYDDTGPDFRASDLPVAFTGRAPVSVAYRLTAMRRGVFHFPQVYVTVQSSAGLAMRRLRLPCRDAVAVHCEVLPVNAEFIAAQRRLSLSTGRRRRPVSGGAEGEFHRLRDYHAGDELRWIDWKASARSGKLITREYEKEQKQTVFLVVDMSRWMALRSGQRSLLDEALSAALMLAGVASSQGDSVGFLAYGSEPHLFYPPASHQPSVLSAAVCSLMPEDRSIYLEGMSAFLRKVLRRETILVMFTSVPHQEGIAGWVKCAGMLSSEHRPLLVLLENDETVEVLKDSPLEEIRRICIRNQLFPLPDIPELKAEHIGARQLAAFHYLKEKERRLRLLSGAGVVVTTRKGLNPSVLSAYLKIRFASGF
jgi:uncharacterized protein (DUF58 family)